MNEDYNQYEDARNLHDQCKKYRYYHVTLSMKDGSSLDGIIEDVGMDRVTVLAGEDVMEQESENEGYNRQFYDGYGRPRRRFRRFRRRDFPFASLAALALLPYITPYPYPYYPYYPQPYYPYPYY
ncbi:small nuclear ribonucleoprotein [Halobacillus andaensis]|uniref:small nuclear ribonucleoprotein n=1 Tax=Halobacillus andaensis TaxID=1176239 RepID=UPI003D74E25E